LSIILADLAFICLGRTGWWRNNAERHPDESTKGYAEKTDWTTASTLSQGTDCRPSWLESAKSLSMFPCHSWIYRLATL